MKTFVLILGFAALAAQASDFSTSFAKSIDVMKYTKDVLTNQPSQATIYNLASLLAVQHVNYLAISIPMDPSSDYPASNKPYPNDTYVFTKQWADAIHSQGKRVMWRGTWSGIEGIYNFPQRVGPNRFPAGTAASATTDGKSTWLGKTYQYIVGNPGFFADGDIWAPLPERTQGIFQDGTSFLSYDPPGIQASYAKFFADLNSVSALAFTKIGRQVVIGMSSNNYTEVISGWIPQSFFDNVGIVSIDYYGNTHTPQEMDADLRKMAVMHHHPIFLQEWSDYWNSDTTMSVAQRTVYLQSMYAEMQKLVNDGVLVGFNYWGGWDNVAEGILTRDNNGFHLNYRGSLLSQFFGANSWERRRLSRRKPF